MEKQLKHEGTVASICGNSMVVRIGAHSACGSCAAKGYCLPFGNKDKDIRVEGFSGDFVSGERVKVVMQQSLGMRALCLGYIVPLTLAIAGLTVALQVTENELAGGLLSLLVLVPYYFVLKMFNSKITKTFGFTVQKIDIS